jgi:uncharacterized protein
VLEVWQWLLLAVGSVVAGAVNTLAGGGTLLTVPLLILVGLGPNSANATNRIGTLTQSVTSTWAFRRRGVSGLEAAAALLPASLLGTALGAWLATVISDEAFRQVFGWLMIPMAAAVFLAPEKRLLAAARPGKPRVLALSLAFLVVGVYTGFAQAGYGLAALAVLVYVGGENLSRSNAIKVALSVPMAVVSLVIMASRLEIHVGAGLVMAFGSALGGYLGTLATLRRGATWLRPVMLAVCVGLAIKLIVG